METTTNRWLRNTIGRGSAGQRFNELPGISFESNWLVRKPLWHFQLLVVIRGRAGPAVWP